MARRLDDVIELMKTHPDKGRGSSKPTPSEAMVRSTSLELPRPVSDHGKAKRHLTAKTVAFSALLTLWLSMMAAVGLASRPACSRHWT